VGYGGSAEPHADGIKVLEVSIGKIGITLCQVVDGLIHPVLLIVLLRLEDATSIDVTEELVPSPVHHTLFGHGFLLL
jgi:hypothetical protein